MFVVYLLHHLDHQELVLSNRDCIGSVVKTHSYNAFCMWCRISRQRSNGDGNGDYDREYRGGIGESGTYNESAGMGASLAVSGEEAFLRRARLR